MQFCPGLDAAELTAWTAVLGGSRRGRGDVGAPSCFPAPLGTNTAQGSESVSGRGSALLQGLTFSEGAGSREAVGRGPSLAAPGRPALLLTMENKRWGPYSSHNSVLFFHSGRVMGKNPRVKSMLGNPVLCCDPVMIALSVGMRTHTGQCLPSCSKGNHTGWVSPGLLAVFCKGHILC